MFLADLVSKSSLTDWLMFVVALVALIVAWRQLREARFVREEQAQPNVFIDMRRVKGNVIELYVKNIGSTIAYDVQLKSTPDLESTNEHFWIFENIPALVPDQEWSTIWENNGQERFKSDLPETYHVDVIFKDSKGKEHTVPNILDWRSQWQRVFRISKDMDDVANRLTDIRNEHRKFTREIQQIALSLGPDEAGEENIIESLRGIYRKLPTYPDEEND